MSENLRWYTKALYGFDHVVRLAPADGWDRRSPCEGWTARHVVGHVTGVQRYLEALVRGQKPRVNPMVDPHLIAGDDPAAAWASARDSMLETLDHSGVLHRVVTSFRGEEEVDDLIGFNVIDTTVHAWDLARAFGVDDRLDPGLVQRATALALPVVDAMRSPMLFGDRVEPSDPSDPQAVLLAATGRRP